MPPPTALDPWLASRRFGIVIDAGSSGSRLQIYSWKDARTLTDSRHLNTLPKVQKGTKNAGEWVSKVEPGISTFALNPKGVAAYLAPLLRHAQDNIPPRLHRETPVFLLATAGMRLLSSSQQTGILRATCDFLRFHSDFRLDQPSDLGPCGSSVRIISGEEEGLFGWIAVNYLMDGFSSKYMQRTTYGFLDMGGASTQIAFEPSIDSDALIEVRLRLLGGEEIRHRVFVTTWLGYGTNQARERYVGSAINAYELTRATMNVKTIEEHIPDPCLPRGLELIETPVHVTSATPHSRKAHKLVGTGSFTQCMQETAPLLNKEAPCPDAPCLFNGVPVPHIDFSVSRFIGVSEYWYSSEHVFGLGGAYDFVQYEKAAVDFCRRDWSQIVEEHRRSKQRGHLGGDGEIEEGGQIIGTGKWGAEVELPRLEMQCFKAAWIANVLHEGIGIPRITDPGGHGQVGEGGAIANKKAGQKGLGAPPFQSLDIVGDTAITWTLGKMVLEACKEIEPASKASRPLKDPLDMTPDAMIPPKKPLLDFDAFEDRISHRLPSSLSRHSLGFSLFTFLFYLSVTVAFLSVTHRLRHRLRLTCRRLIRRVLRRDHRDLIYNSYSMEEGLGNGSYNSPPYSRPTSPPPARPNIAKYLFLSAKARIISFFPIPSLSQVVSVTPFHTSSLRSRATYSNANGLTSSVTFPALQRTASPPPYPANEDNPSSPVYASLSIPSRSRNSSQTNLAARASRSDPQTPTGSTFPDD